MELLTIKPEDFKDLNVDEVRVVDKYTFSSVVSDPKIVAAYTDDPYVATSKVIRRKSAVRCFTYANIMYIEVSE